MNELTTNWRWRSEKTPEDSKGRLVQYYGKGFQRTIIAYIELLLFRLEIRKQVSENE